MVERRVNCHNIGQDFDMDDVGNMVYWSSPHRKCWILKPGEIIDDMTLMIGKVGQQNILPNHLSLKTKDLEFTQIKTRDGIEIGYPVPPGVSGFVYFGTHQSKQVDLSQLAVSCVGREITRKNRLYVTQVGDIVESGWIPVFAPLIDDTFKVRNPLHVIICPKSVYESRTIQDATESEKVDLSRAFIRWENI